MTNVPEQTDTRVAGWVAALVLAALFIAAGLGGYYLRDVLTPEAAPLSEVVDSEIERWSKVAQDDPESVTARLNLAYAYQSDRQYDRALEQYAAVLRTEPANVTALYQQGVIYLALQLEKDGEASLWKALDAQPDHVQAAAALGRYYASKAQYRSVVTAVRPTVVLKPQSAELQYLMGLAYENTGNRNWAMERYRMSLAAAPDFVEAREGVARLRQLGVPVPDELQ